MKANELMLGDYVTIKDCQQDTTPTIIKIWQINADNEAFVSIDGSDSLDEIAIDDEIVGLPITQEILENNGFQNKRLFGELICGEWKILCNCIHLAIFHENVCRLNIHCEYVHQLQQALRLVGIEKEITL